jgi:UDPglucose 6-dehydrogenase
MHRELGNLQMPRSLRLSVIGAGYVGLATAVGLAGRGHEIDLVETRPDRLEMLRAGLLPIHEPGMAAKYADPETKSRIHPMATPAPGSDLLLVCVGTPIDQEGRSDLRQVESALRSIADLAAAGIPVVIRSTLPAGSGETMAEWLGGDTSRLFANPEFLRQGHAIEDFLKPTRVVIGAFPDADPEALALIKEVLYFSDCALLVVGMAEADLIKNGANAFLALKLSFANEMAVLCEALGADVVKVLEGIGLDKRIGGTYMQPSFGFGGSCLPKDLCALTNVGKSYGLAMHVTAAASEANADHQLHFANRIADLMPPGCRRVAMLGLAFKAGTDDTRSSPALQVAQMLFERGFEIAGYDPQANANAAREMPGLIVATSAQSAAAGAGVTVIGTEWPEFRDLDWASLAPTMAAPIVIDGRRLLEGERMRALGYHFETIGAPIPRKAESGIS